MSSRLLSQIQFCKWLRRHIYFCSTIFIVVFSLWALVWISRTQCGTNKKKKFYHALVLRVLLARTFTCAQIFLVWEHAGKEANVFEFGARQSYTKSVPMKKSFSRLLRQNLRSLNFVEYVASLTKDDYNGDALSAHMGTLFFLKRSVHVLNKKFSRFLCIMRALILFNAYELAWKCETH